MLCEIQHLGFEQLIDLLVVHSLLRLRGVPDASGVPLVLIVILAALQIAAVLPQKSNHWPAPHLLDLLLCVAHGDELLLDLGLLELPQICIRPSHTLRILNCWIEISPDGHAVFQAVVRNLERHLEEREATVTIRWITDAPNHYHAALLLGGHEVVR